MMSLKWKLMSTRELKKITRKCWRSKLEVASLSRARCAASKCKRMTVMSTTNSKVIEVQDLTLQQHLVARNSDLNLVCQAHLDSVRKCHHHLPYQFTNKHSLNRRWVEHIVLVVYRICKNSITLKSWHKITKISWQMKKGSFVKSKPQFRIKSKNAINLKNTCGYVLTM